jgi:hypothetical protein
LFTSLARNAFVAESIHQLAEAKALHRSGRLQDAELLYRQVVQAESGQPARLSPRDGFSRRPH